MRLLRHAFRSLWNSPGFTIAAVLCLALGIGANTAIFTVVDAVLFRPLPFRQPEGLVRIYTEFPTYGSSGGFRKFWMSTPELLDLRRVTTSWESLDAYTLTGANLVGTGDPIRVTAAAITGGMMPALGVAPQLGRYIAPDDDRPGIPPTMVISDGLWKRAFGGDRNVLNQTAKVNGMTVTILGVMPAGFAFPPGEVDPPEIWFPQQINPANPGGRASHFQNVVGRLKPGTSLERAREELRRVMTEQEEHKSPNVHSFDTKFHTLVAFPYHDEIVGNVRPAMLVMLAAVGFVLLIACVNVGNLLLARAESRHHEMAVRKAMGATVWDLARQCVVEGMCLAGLGAAAGLGVAWAALQLLLAFNQGSIPRADEIGMDWRVLFFTLGASLVTGILFGLAPLAQFAGDASTSLRSGTGRTTATTGAHLLRRAMVVAELALALLLLVGAGLMVRTFWKLQQVNIGLDPARVVTMRLAVPPSQMRESKDVQQLWGRVLERVESLPGVEGVSVATGLPPLRALNADDTDIEGYVKKPGGPDGNVSFYQGVSARYFEMMRVPIVEGRALDARDGANAPFTAVVNQTMARAFFGNESPIGRRLRRGRAGEWRTIVGVAADVKNAGVDQPTGTEVYFPNVQGDGVRNIYLLVKTAGDPQNIVRAVREQIRNVDGSLPVAQVRLMSEVIDAATTRPRFLTVLLSLFSFIALGLAAVGIYGVMAYTVAQRTREFGIRMAVGAERSDVLWLVLRQGLQIGLVGVALGAAGAFALTRLLRQLLFGVEAFDPATFAVTAIGLTAVILAACYIPARRATRVDPMTALRYE
ncbi:MAG TPA: ABC transporter permease [Bryobacteraceae bacterium]|nr:ABC transporter permease [Bryobacteraceae bacterium]